MQLYNFKWSLQFTKTIIVIPSLKLINSISSDSFPVFLASSFLRAMKRASCQEPQRNTLRRNLKCDDSLQEEPQEIQRSEKDLQGKLLTLVLKLPL